MTLVTFSEQGFGSLQWNSSVANPESTESNRRSNKLIAWVVLSPSGMGPQLHLNQECLPESAPTWEVEI